MEGHLGMALKKTPPRERRLHMAKAWIPTYNIVKGYRKHFVLSPLGAVADLLLMGYEFTPEYIEQLKRDEVNRSNLKRNKKKNRLNSLSMMNLMMMRLKNCAGLQLMMNVGVYHHKKKRF